LSSGWPAGADDFLPVLIYVAVFARVKAIHHHLHFILTCAPQQMTNSGEEAYYLTQVKNFSTHFHIESLHVEFFSLVLVFELTIYCIYSQMFFWCYFCVTQLSCALTYITAINRNSLKMEPSEMDVFVGVSDLFGDPSHEGSEDGSLDDGGDIGNILVCFFNAFYFLLCCSKIHI
jgi:hypothetical protein